ncbi:hypothetical protein [Altererythrobacter lutimaris]|uniref:Uncharacterized protein n=1 Tax=Altererythrobacter lutimaris TaxID=2743979 RepID=A0A850H655_9SPHN|nr:hypothetical protein [Altererythrobacter lutimaris]NVE94714.1 hypothetical protein [Altererythrobacter lutimaris]
MDLLANRYVQMLIGAVTAIALAIWVVAFFTEDEPEPDIWCAFKGVNGQGPVFMGRVQGPVERVAIRGLLSKPRVGNTYDINGSATFQYRGQRRNAVMEGEVTVDGNDRVTYLDLSLTGEELGRNGLTMATLDGNGRAAPDRSRAYLYRDSRFRLSHPMFYACSVDFTANPPATTE